jgi:predicted Zn-dependent protease
MKKFLAVIVSFILSASVAFAATTNWNSAAQMKRINNIGTKIIKANKLPAGIAFKLSEEDHVNAYANIDKEVYVYKGLLQFVQNDQELAAVISHEIGHIINAHCAKQTMVNFGANVASSLVKTKYDSEIQAGKELTMLSISRSDEYEADLTGVDLMIKAGYDPKAMISVLNKFGENSIDVFSTHPSGINRLMNIYDYLEYTYPNTVKTTYNTASYKAAIKDINEKVAKRNAKKNGAEKQKRKMAKLVEKRQKAMTRNTARTSDPWTSSYTVIKSLTGN